MLTPSAVARRLGVSRSTVCRWMTEGALPWTRIAGRRRIPAAALRTWMEAQTAAALSELTKPARRVS